MEEVERVHVQVPGEVVRIVEVASISNDVAPVRLTPTGKISHAKTRVYTQRYRKEWEYTSDFKDWLTSVPDEETRAFCKFCNRNLHAHRLSLLKHMCTLKHQRAAAQHKKDLNDLTPKRIKIENARTCDDFNDNQDEEEEEDTMEETHEEIEESEIEIEEETPSSPEKYKRDTLEQAMIHVNSHFIPDSEDVHMEMVIESENEDGNDDNNSQIFEIQQKESNNSSELDERAEIVVNNDEGVNSIVVADGSDTPADAKKMYLFSVDGKTYTIFKSYAPVASKATDESKESETEVEKEDNVTEVRRAESLSEVIITPVTSAPVSPSSSPTIKTTTVAATTIDKKIKSPETSNKDVTLQKVNNNRHKGAMVSTYVLDTSKGAAVSGLQVILYKLSDGRWNFVQENSTSADGVCNNFSKTLTPGRYKFHYDVEKYYNTRKVATIYPFIEIVFDIKDPQRKYHVPLMISPYSYSTHRDVLR